MSETQQEAKARCRQDALLALIALEGTSQQYSVTQRNLQHHGWSAEEVLDLIIDDELLPAAPGVAMAIRESLNPDELRTRRVVRGQLAVAEGLSRLETAIRSLEATIVAGRGKGAAGEGVSNKGGVPTAAKHPVVPR